MDQFFREFSSSSNGIHLENQSMVELSDQKLADGPRFEITYPDQKLVNEQRFQNTLPAHDFEGFQMIQNEPFTSSAVSSSSLGVEDDYDHEDCDFSDAVLRYINQMLMEEDMEEKTHMLQESLELQAKEKSLYDVLGKKYPPSPVQNPSPDDFFPGNHHHNSSSSGYLIDVIDPRWTNSHVDSNACHAQLYTAYNASNSSNSLKNIVDEFSDSPVSHLQVSDMCNESRCAGDFRKGAEDASKFLPSGNGLLVSTGIHGTRDPNGEFDVGVVKVEDKDEDGHKQSQSESKGRKNPRCGEMVLEEERSNKLAAIYAESTIRSEEFDIVLLHTMGDGRVRLADYRTELQNATSKRKQQNGQTKRSGGAKGRGKNRSSTKEVVDLRTLLVNCAQAVAADDRRSANELLEQIRRHSSPLGDDNQRLAHYLADGLEARLAGTGSQIYKALVNRRTLAADFLKAFHLYLASSPFRKISNFASSKTINIKSQDAMRVHVIDFGILYGFQWPTFLQRISEREGGPPRVRITGIEFPQPGFRPAERIEETGCRLTDYAKTFNVPFEYNAIAKKWETIKIEELKIEKDEFLVVNCLYRTKNLLDETVMAESSRTAVLNLIRKINPNIFIHGIVNGAYGAPFFVTRFREALFHFSALFNMLETNVPREKTERMLIERDIFGREALNVIACEGWERVERPETYKQWQVRDLKAGFLQIPFERKIVNMAKYKVRSTYHKDYVIDEDSQWMLLGWKGRTIYALSCWKPV
ncbi:scarecrow-like protein 9 [Olea europaea var. sylvestris]|uniref:scarecrow-like protein 9 n=1 Tax=Olea europaea var. sylvestris TaxID=158386 RepID=UPI000C1D0C7D|nr:scarecrow-like protein 9 [Olea europaea var. sylvestris]XP_022865266.1 scarecrow-like protein 9 [Olea europaea var. sylvestris]XP_022865267.1 scarecrow-like protein 9 [Olea europaea var. sylvestris]XP_022865268.1 scarecrow-like protein 9 [Olea europaea var. sylvestris]